MIKVGDYVDVYVPIGEPPYEHETRLVIGIDYINEWVHLDDNSSAGIDYCTLIK